MFVDIIGNWCRGNKISEKWSANRSEKMDEKHGEKYRE
jgi:hypothetical protein